MQWSFGMFRQPVARRATPIAVGSSLVALSVSAIVMSVGVTPAAAAGVTTVVSRGVAASAIYASESTTSLTLSLPAGTQAGDVLIASIGFGRSGAVTQPALTAPPDWTVVSRTDHGTTGALAVYRGVVTPGQNSYTWTTSVRVGGTAFLAAFGGVDTASPIDVSAGRDVTDPGRSLATPSVTTTGPSAMLIASFSSFRAKAKNATWTPPASMTEIGDVSNGNHSGSVDYALQSATGQSGTKVAGISSGQDYGVAALTALRPAPAITGSPVITAVAARSGSATGNTITWITDLAADSQVDFGVTASYGSSNTLDSAQLTSHSQAISGLTPNTVYHYRVKSRAGTGQLSTSGDYTFQTGTTGRAPLVIDTDMFSDADDVGAVASAFALQLRSETSVIALGVNTRTDRPAVATNSWRCLAAVAQFYDAPGVPIGVTMPSNGTAVNSPDFIGPCSTLASPSTPEPETAVSVYRRALAGQVDKSVTMVGIGYSGNLAALLRSSPDSVSALSGSELVARKVAVLVVMAGGYPSRSGENNLIGDVAAAQTVARSWPTRIVWSGYEVGDAVHTGNTISATHPTNSPVRVAYEAFVAPGNWIYSYDLVGVYYAVRPLDASLAESAPGTNVVDDYGGNRFTTGPGTQTYLELRNAAALDSSIETLLDTLPGP